ncbi:MAG TPA: type VI secretion system tube protein Hcp [Tepidisphaeraceae bacterium]|nr:type VI secretion system tube protein Hcp [Tepidisphaeraceae bacterium]
MNSRITSHRPALIETLENRMLLSAVPVGAHLAHVKPAVVHAVHKPAVVHVVHKPAHYKAPKVIGDPIYMQFGDIKGDVQVSGYAGDIELNSFQFGVGRGISSPTGGSSDRESSAPSVSEITITKAMDKASPLLFSSILSGPSTPEVDIFFVNIIRGQGGRSTQVYAEYQLSNVLISGYSVSSGGDRPTESLSLNFTKIVYTHITQNADGTTTPTSVGYDLAQAKTT